MFTSNERRDGQTAVLAEWLKMSSNMPDAHPQGLRATLSSAVANLNPGAFSFVMGTGIVSTGLYVNGAHGASAALLWVSLVAFAVLLPAYSWRLLRWRERFFAEFLGPRSFAFLTIAIASNVVAARLVPSGHTAVAAGFLALGASMWLFLGYSIPLGLITSTRRRPSVDQVNGTGFLWSVGADSTAVAAASLAHVTTGGFLPAVAAVCWAIALVQYLLVAAIVLLRLFARPVAAGDLMTSLWIFMGAATISVLAGARLVELSPGSVLLPPSVLTGWSVVLWSFASWLIPLLLALGVWRHGVQKIPLRYEFGWWNLVFPIGMYGVASHELGRTTKTAWMTSLGQVEIWVALGVWAVVTVAMAITAANSVVGTSRRRDASTPAGDP
ncbi:tellurite resistance/C4-dicarboxylate transporter family protein [Streptomyces sp. NPDC004250]|uniref:tellurite resistance/C4-dicarboxylate transporter family protein n=1 Tax=Streptomyces sp. NPDC004250 TaxID=3364692 RepID=UPI0036961885